MALNWFINSAYTLVSGHSVAEISKETAAKSSENRKEMISQVEKCGGNYLTGFQIPLHYPKYKKKDYEKMEEWKIDMLLREYGLSFNATLEEKRQFAIGTFLWPNQFKN